MFLGERELFTVLNGGENAAVVLQYFRGRRLHQERQHLINKQAHGVVTCRFMGRVNSRQLVVIVSKVPLQKQLFVGELSPFWYFLNNF